MELFAKIGKREPTPPHIQNGIAALPSSGKRIPNYALGPALLDFVVSLIPGAPHEAIAERKQRKVLSQVGDPGEAAPLS
jgi:hypothetical protein